MEKHFYSQQELDFLAEHMHECDYDTLARMFSEKFDVPMTKSKVNNAIKSHKLGRKIAETSRWTEDMVAYLRDNYMSMEINALAENINAKFGVSVSPHAVSHKMRAIGVKKNDYQVYSEEEDNWLRENFYKYPMSKLVKEFTSIFGRKVSASGLNSHTINALSLKKGTMHVYTKAEDKWLKEHFFDFTQFALAKEFNDTFSCDVTIGPLLQHCNKVLGLRKDNQHQWTDAETELLKVLVRNGCYYADMIPIFEKNFGFKPTVNALKCRTRVINVYKEKHEGFTKEQDDWLIEKALTFPNYAVCADVFNEKFGTDKTERGIQSHCLRILKVMSGRQAFKKGSQPWCTHEKYHETVRDNGYTYVKLGNKNWIPKQQYVWEQANGKLKDGEFVIFLNGDKTDFSMENLAVVNRKNHAMMCSRGWYSDIPMLTKTGVLACELESTIGQLKKGE